MTLDLPPVTPLPPDVRRRALDTVLDGLDAPAPRRVRPELVAAAVVVALLVSLTAALSWAGRPPLVVAAGAAEVDIRSTEGMISRCAAAVAGNDEYPPADEWGVRLGIAGSYTDPVIIVDDAFACRLTPVGVYVSGTRGTPMGEVEVVDLGPGVVVLLNPQRRVIAMDDADWNVSREPDAAVQLLVSHGADRPDTRFTVADGYSGPLPDPAPPAVSVRDRALPVRDRYGSPEATDEDNDLENCVTTGTFPAGGPEGELWTPVRRIEGGADPLLLARIGDQYVGLCALTADGPIFHVAPMPSREGIAVEPGDDLVPLPTLRFSLDGGHVRGWDQTSDLTATEPCTTTDGVAVCGDAGGWSGLDVRLITPSEDLTVPRAPGR